MMCGGCKSLFGLRFSLRLRKRGGAEEPKSPVVRDGSKAVAVRREAHKDDRAIELKARDLPPQGDVPQFHSMVAAAAR